MIVKIRGEVVADPEEEVELTVVGVAAFVSYVETQITSSTIVPKKDP